MHPEFQAQPKDEILEQIWCRREDGDESLSGLTRETEEENARELVSALVEEGLVRIDDDRLRLTEAGERRARMIIRGHRLAKRFLHDVLALPEDETERTACLMEHVLSPTAADAVCSLLGHPPTSLLGRQIPPGECCRSGRSKDVKPLVVPLHELEYGKLGRIVFMTPRYRKRFERLGTFGVVPGSVIRLRQTQPSVVIELEGTSLALDRDVAREIFVARDF